MRNYVAFYSSFLEVVVDDAGGTSSPTLSLQLVRINEGEASLYSAIGKDISQFQFLSFLFMDRSFLRDRPGKLLEGFQRIRTWKKTPLLFHCLILLVFFHPHSSPYRSSAWNPSQWSTLMNRCWTKVTEPVKNPGVVCTIFLRWEWEYSTFSNTSTNLTRYDYWRIVGVWSEYETCSYSSLP